VIVSPACITSGMPPPPARRSMASNAAGSLLPTIDRTGEHTVYVFLA
jgi:hypothetical protein